MRMCDQHVSTEVYHTRLIQITFDSIEYPVPKSTLAWIVPFRPLQLLCALELVFL